MVTINCRRRWYARYLKYYLVGSQPSSCSSHNFCWYTTSARDSSYVFYIYIKQFQSIWLRQPISYHASSMVCQLTPFSRLELQLMLLVAIQCQSHRMLTVDKTLIRNYKKVVSLYLIYISPKNYATVHLFSQAWGWGHPFSFVIQLEVPLPLTSHAEVWALELATNIYTIYIGCY